MEWREICLEMGSGCHSCDLATRCQMRSDLSDMGQCASHSITRWGKGDVIARGNAYMRLLQGDIILRPWNKSRRSRIYRDVKTGVIASMNPFGISIVQRKKSNFSTRDLNYFDNFFGGNVYLDSKPNLHFDFNRDLENFFGTDLFCLAF